MSWDKERIAQLQLPDPADDDPHPRLLLEGDGVHAGQGFTALFPDGWHDIKMRLIQVRRRYYVLQKKKINFVPDIGDNEFRITSCCV